MKQIVRYQNLSIPNKLRIDTRIIIDEKGAEWSSNNNGDRNMSITLHPMITLVLIKPATIDENGGRVKTPWNPNDNLGMTKYNFPIFINELKLIKEDMKITELYTYTGKRLELNEEIGEKVRRAFIVGKTAIELSSVVVIQQDSVGEDKRVEGIKLKLNNENSTVLLTLNDVESLIYNLEHIDIDSIAINMYTNFINRSNAVPKDYKVESLRDVDIVFNK